jgi:hypothetical protein
MMCANLYHESNFISIKTSVKLLMLARNAQYWISVYTITDRFLAVSQWTGSLPPATGKLMLSPVCVMKGLKSEHKPKLANGAGEFIA